MGARQAAMIEGRSLLLLGRVSNLPTVWSNVLAGILLAGGGLPGPAALAAVMAAATLFYEAGMFLNDAFDRHIDGLDRPERPIPAGAAAPWMVFALGFAMLAGGVALMSRLGWAAGAAGAALAAAILVYDLWHKGNPFSPVLMGSCRALLYIAAGLAVTAAPDPVLAAGAAASLAYVAGLTYTAKQENLAEFRNAWPLAVLAVPFALLLPLADAATIPFAALFAAWTAYALSLVLIPRRRNVRQAVGGFIAGISLLDAAWIAAAGYPGLAWLAVAAFALTLLAQKKVPGT